MEVTTILRTWSERGYLPVLTVLFAVAVLLISRWAWHWDLAVYALSFWHYLVYALAFSWRGIPPRQFRHDAVLLKSLSLAAFAYALWSTPPNAVALGLMGVGFALNIAAARALGTERTYYGYELGDLPGEKITAFPFNVLSHPMLFGNMIAFGAPLLDENFRQHWWPLAVAHGGLNFLILLMEVYARPGRLAGTLWSAIMLTTGSVLLVLGFTDVWQFAVTTVGFGFVFAAALYCRYGKRADGQGPGTRPS